MANPNPEFSAAAMEKVELIFSLCRQVFAVSTEFNTVDSKEFTQDVLLSDGFFTLTIRKATDQERDEHRKENGLGHG